VIETGVIDFVCNNLKALEEIIWESLSPLLRARVKLFLEALQTNQNGERELL